MKKELYLKFTVLWREKPAVGTGGLSYIITRIIYISPFLIHNICIFLHHHHMTNKTFNINMHIIRQALEFECTLCKGKDLTPHRPLLGWTIFV